MAFLSVQEAAKELGLDPSRVRALVSSKVIPGVKVGDRWAIDSAEIARRRRNERSPGRPFEPGNAWAVLFLASNEKAPWLASSVRWRLEQGLAFRGLTGLRSRLSRRAEIHRFEAHPGELRHLQARDELIKSGISAAGRYDLGLVPGEEVDAYIRSRLLKRVQREHALEPAAIGEGNVVLRVVPDSAWHLDDEDHVAPFAAVAVDLAADPDSRSSRVGNNMIKKLDRDRKRS
jgi:excisionase family DNA binding protein